MTSLIVFLIFLVAAILFLPFTQVAKSTQLHTNTLRILLCIKIGAGTLVGWISYHYFPGNDYWNIHQQSLIEQKWLIKDPSGFFKDLFYSPYENTYGGILKGVGSFWNDLRFNLLTKSLAIINFITSGNFYVNTLLFCIGGFLGCIVLYKLFNKLYPENSLLKTIGCFLFPTTLYFCSGLHKDQIVFTCLCLIFYSLYNIYHDKKRRQDFIVLIISFLLLFLFRNYLALLIVLTWIPFQIHFIWKKNPAITYLIFFIVLLSIILMLPSDAAFNPYHIILNRQLEFQQLPQANSQISVPDIHEGPYQFIRQLPNAIDNGLIRPYIWSCNSILSFLASIDRLFLLLIISLGLGSFIILKKTTRPFPVFIISFGILSIVLIGFIVPNYFSIIRYESVFLPFLLLPFLLQWLRGKIKTN